MTTQVSKIYIGIDVSKAERAPAIDQDERIAVAERAQVDKSLAVTAIGIIFRRGVSNERWKLT